MAGDALILPRLDRPAPPPRLARIERAALPALAILTAVWCWWAAKAGAFFGTVMLPGTIALCGAAILLASAAPWRASLRRSPGAVAGLVGLVGLGVWAALSALWSPAPDVAVTDGQRILMYALAFGLGIWVANLLGDRMHLALLPLAVAGAFAGVVAVVGMLTGDNPGQYLETDGTLEFPLGYRNANAAFFLIAFWPAIALAARAENDWRGRALALAAATLCLDLGLLSQSRGSILGGSAALLVFLALSRERGRILLWLVLAALPALAVIPALVDLFGAANSGAPAHSVVDELHAAGGTVAATVVAAAALGAIAALVGRRLPRFRRRAEIANRVTGIGLAAGMVAAVITFVVVVGNPADWLGQRVAEFRSGQAPSTSGSETRFSLNAGTGRPELWRVALLEAGRHPVLGTGAGGYRYVYLENRGPDGPPAAIDAHSVELENLSELGVPGLLLFGCAIVGATWGAVRSRRLGPAAAALSAVSLAAAAYWLVHASLDWFWPYPAVTAPVFALLGSASAPALRLRTARRRTLGRPALIAAALLLAVSAVPPFLSQRYVNAAYAGWHTDTQLAYDDLARARDLDPLSIDPLLAEGAIARADGDRQRAIRAFREAAADRPEEWASHYFLALLYRQRSPALARSELEAAIRRDPRNPTLEQLRHKLAPGG
jgi:hypothetical protein